MRIEIDPQSGFCFGVQKATKAAEKALEQNKPVYCLGEMVHNPTEVARLEQIGLQTISIENLEALTKQTVLIRAHGEPPETYNAIKKHKINLIDATCPVVKALQQKILKTSQTLPNHQIVIFGKNNHPEVVGLNGTIAYQGIVVSDANKDLDKINFLLPIALFSQTTQSETAFQQLATEIKSRIIAKGGNPATNLTIINSICKQVSGRKPALIHFAKSMDVVVFVSGANSSNGQYLYSICHQTNPRSYMVQNTEQIERHWFHNALSIGISGATSTPHWQLQTVKTAIEKILE
ncbi:MAG TPA: 4-hydroxy-3-methylbut-2-enyl diphosphate reductase [Bacteroidales bacterium]|nr:4-hydroxy-3-methylbut-2-enyl diphosphate reductase [Bacteroidales bacterium]